MARFLLTLLITGYFAVANAMAAEPENWVVYYGDAIPADKFLNYDTVVFDSVSHPPLRPLQNRGKALLGYLSIGEVEDYRDDFAEIKKMGVLLNANKDWPGHYVVDIRNPLWVKYLIEEKIPQILFKRFDGLFLDTLDSPLYLEELHPEKYKGMKEAAVNLLAAIRMHYPDIKVMLNRGLGALPEAAEHVDMLLLETTMANINAKKKTYKWFPKHVYQEILSIAQKARQASPDLKIYTLDYWNPRDVDGVKKIYRTQRENGFIPYVSTIDLQDLVEEPK